MKILNCKKRRRGATLIEFTLLGIPAIFLCTTIATTSIDMWQFFTLNYAVSATARYASMHGATCVYNATSNPNNNCTVTQSQIATYFQNDAIALAAGSTTLKLTDGSGTTTCDTATPCSTTAVYPSESYDTVGSNITIKASYTLLNPIFMFWPGGGSGVTANNFTVSASSTQAILF